jgi:hypothetical protein
VVAGAVGRGGPSGATTTLFSNTLSLRSSLDVSDHVSHPHNRTCKITLRHLDKIMLKCVLRKCNEVMRTGLSYSVSHNCGTILVKKTVVLGYDVRRL